MQDNKVVNGMIEIEQRFHDAYTRISRDRHHDLLALLERYRMYPDGHEFYYPSPEDGELHLGSIVCGYLPNAEIGGIGIWYSCSIPTLYTHEGEIVPLEEKTISMAIAKFGTPRQEA
jgi:hypothetical protein